MKTALKRTTYQVAKFMARPFGLYPFPRTHRRHMMTLLNRLNINCVLDVGAHYGEFGSLLRELGFTGHIRSFEPSSESFRRLQSASARDSKWKTFPFALGSSDGETEIHLYRSSDFNSLLAPSGVESRFEGCTDEVGIETIAVHRLDSVFDTCMQGISNPRVYLKMDTQGFDLEVVRGASGVLPKIMAMQSELPGICYYENQPLLCEALSYYWTQGFRPTGFFPVNHERDGITVMEWDCVLMRQAAPSETIH